MAQIVSDVRDFVAEKAAEVAQAVTQAWSDRKIALITGITGQVGVRNRTDGSANRSRAIRRMEVISRNFSWKRVTR